jgi:hypothetical protein
MKAGKYNIEVQRGATFILAVKLTAANVAMLLTGYKARAQMRTDYGAATAFLTFTSDDGSILIDEELGRLELIAPASDTTLITPDEGVWDLELVAPSGIVYRILYGDVLVTPEVTLITNA